MTLLKLLRLSMMPQEYVGVVLMHEKLMIVYFSENLNGVVSKY